MSDRNLMQQAFDAMSYGDAAEREAARLALRERLAQPERHELQAKGEHPAPCARHCEANAFQIVIKNLQAQLAQPEQPTELEWWKARALQAERLVEKFGQPEQEPVDQLKSMADMLRAEVDRVIAAKAYLKRLKDEQERKHFEHWYSTNAFDYESHPIGSRECGLQWKAWKARAAHGIRGGACLAKD